MPSLLSAADINSFTGDFQDLFDTFKRNITIYKEPKKTISNVNLDSYHGYGESAQKANITYTSVSEVHQAVVSYKDRQDAEEIANIGLMYFAGDARIKVDSTTKEYILNGKTEKILIDGKAFNLLTEDSIKNFFGIRLYVFHLQATK